MDAERLIDEIRAIDPGIYPASVVKDGVTIPRDRYGDGWNACASDYGFKIIHAVERAANAFDYKERLFAASDLFIYEPERYGWAINLGDTWYYASADLELVKPDDMDDVYRYLLKYGSAGLLYWVYLRRGHLPEIPERRLEVEAIKALIEAKQEEKRKLEEWRANMAATTSQDKS